MTIFIVNGKEKELRMDVGGVDVSADFIGNTYHGMDDDEEGRYVASQEDFNWWRDVISSHLDMANIIEAYKEDNDPDEVDRVVNEWIGVDYENQPGQVAHGLEQNFGKL